MTYDPLRSPDSVPVPPAAIPPDVGTQGSPGFTSSHLPAHTLVLLLAPSISATPGGITRYADGLLTSPILKARGYGFRHITTHQSGQWIQKAGAMLRAGASLAFLRRDAQIAHALIASDNSCYRKLALLSEARYAGLKTVAHFHGSTLVEWLNALGPRHRDWVIRTTARCSAVITLGGRIAEYLHNVGMDRSLYVIPNGVQMTPHERVAPSMSKLVLFVGKLGARKGVPDLLRAFQMLPIRHRLATLILMGDGEVQATRNLAAALGIADRVTCTGWSEELAVHAHMDRAAVLVLPSYHENMSLSVLEAMMRGLPVITTPVGEHGSVIDDGRDGVLVPPGDVPALRSALERLLDDPALAARLGTAARQRALREFSLAANHHRIADVYDAVSPSRKASAPHR